MRLRVRGLSGLLAALSAAVVLSLGLSGPVRADGGSDTQDITINANDIALIDIKDISTTTNTAGDDGSGISFTFDESTNDTAGEELSEVVEKDALLAWSINYDAKITVCTQGEFNNFGGDSDSDSYLELRANDSGLASGSGSENWITLWEANQGINCDDSENLITGLDESYDPGSDANDPELTYRAQYDVEDGQFSGDSIDTKVTILAQ